MQAWVHSGIPHHPGFQPYRHPRFRCTLFPGRWSWVGNELTMPGIYFPCPLWYVAAFPIAHRAHPASMAQPRPPAVCARVPFFTILEGAITALACGPPPRSERSRGVTDNWLGCFRPHDCFHLNSCSLSYSYGRLGQYWASPSWPLSAQCRASWWSLLMAGCHLLICPNHTVSILETDFSTACLQYVHGLWMGDYLMTICPCRL